MKVYNLHDRLIGAYACATLVVCANGFAKKIDSTATLRLICANHAASPTREIVLTFERLTGTSVTIETASNDQIVAHDKPREPFDIFIVTDDWAIKSLVEHGAVTSGTTTCVAMEHWVVWHGGNTSTSAKLRRLSDLRNPDYAKWRVAIPDPEDSRNGAEALAFLQHDGLVELLGPRIINAGKVRGAVEMVEMGQVECAILPASKVPDGSSVSANLLNLPGKGTQVLVGLSSVAPTLAEARAFVEFLTTPNSMAIWRRYRFSKCDE